MWIQENRVCWTLSLDSDQGEKRLNFDTILACILEVFRQFMLRITS
jgi:hypothetical protein